MNEFEPNPIPKNTDAYDSLTFVHTQLACVYKKMGYTPLQVLRSFSGFLLPEEMSRATYVGRLDPMAEGWMHVLWSGNMEEKEKIASSDKMYEIEVVFGISTDTGDTLGLVMDSVAPVLNIKDIEKSLLSFIGPFHYPYPTYSSPNIKQTLRNSAASEVKMQKGSISKIELVDSAYVDKDIFQNGILHTLSLSKMDGDFRLEDIQEKWKCFFLECKENQYLKIKLRVSCTAGTYMRTLAREIGKKHSSSSFASSIKRIGITYCIS
jgi:tRNA pseudouridine55 synthase